jgi:hypothetical protein
MNPGKWHLAGIALFTITLDKTYFQLRPRSLIIKNGARTFFTDTLFFLPLPIVGYAPPEIRIEIISESVFTRIGVHGFNIRYKPP